MKKNLFIIVFLMLAPLAQAQKFNNYPRTQGELQLLINKANGGDIRSQYELGCCYMEGVDGLLSRKQAKGKALLKQAAKGGSADACRMLFKIDPLRNEKYRDEAIRIYKEWNTGEAFYNIADMYSYAPKLCQRWLKMSMQAGYSQAETDLQAWYKSTRKDQSFDNWVADIEPIVDVEVTEQKVRPIQQPENNLAASNISDVDKDLPRAEGLNKNTIAIILGNQNYKKMAPVSFAQNDAGMFARYCESTLGLPRQNIKLMYDVTLGEMTDLVEDQLPVLARQYGSSLNVIFYYAGHGFPDEETHEAVLVPVDARNVKSKSVYKMDKLTSELGKLDAKQVTVFVDACFSGSQRGNGMLADVRGVAIAPKKEAPKHGNIVVFSAASGNQTAWPYKAKGHGLFTYYLLKKLQETAGNVPMGELSDYLKNNVEYTSAYQGNSQSPVTTPSIEVENQWRSWKLK